LVQTCRRCGLRRRLVWFCIRSSNELRNFHLFALAGKTEWTDTPRTCVEVLPTFSAGGLTR
jgi:hypothetical protein